MKTPHIFIASSVEGLNIAYELQKLLIYEAECTVWDQKVFSASSVPLLDLVKQTEKNDYGIFVFSFDDAVISRNQKKQAVRDNVLFELGLFIGSIGISNCFIVEPELDKNKKMRIPSDLMGIQPLKYKHNREDKNLSAALGPVASEIRNQISKNRSNGRIPESLKEQISNAGLSGFYCSRNDYAKYRKDAVSIDKYIGQAEESVVMTGITLATGITNDDICKVLRDKLKRNKKFKVNLSLLNPEKDELYMALDTSPDAEPQALQERTKASLSKLTNFKTKLPKEAQKRVSIKVHDKLPFGSAIIIDGNTENGKIQIETKPYKLGMRQSFAFEITKREKNELYQNLYYSFMELINDGKDWCT